MTDASSEDRRSPPRLPLVARLLRAGLRAGIRGSTRASFTLPRWFASLRAIPIVVNGRETLFVDLRNGLAHPLLAGSPWSSAPWETDEQVVMRTLVRRSDVVLDIGANIGLHTTLLSNLVGPAGHVHAFEPNEELLHALGRTAEYAGNVTVHNVGLSDRAETREFYVPEDLSMASLADWTEGRVGAVQVKTCRLAVLDDLLAAGTIRQPRFIKCDIEGAEALAFRGGRLLLDRSDAPMLLYEANALSVRAFGFALATATAFLRGLERPGYQIFHVQPNGAVVSLPDFRPDCEHYNLLAAPSARLQEIQPLMSGG